MIVPFKEIYSFSLEKAKEIQESSNQFSYDSKNTPKDKLKNAAQLFLRLGEFQLYCECQIKLGNWNKALAFAPRVSYDYWKQLTIQCEKSLREEDSTDSMNALLANNQIIQAIKLNSQNGKLSEALEIAQIFSIPRKYYTEVPDNSFQTHSEQLKEEKINDILFQISDSLAQSNIFIYMVEGDPLLAAAQCLQLNDISGTLQKLIRANLIYYAFILSQLIKISYCFISYFAYSEPEEKLEITQFLFLKAKRFQAIGKFQKLVLGNQDQYHSITIKEKEQLLLFLNSSVKSKDEMQQYLSEIKIPGLEQLMLEQSKSIEQNSTNLIIERQFESSVDTILKFIQSLNNLQNKFILGIFKNKQWNQLGVVFPLMKLLRFAKVNEIQKEQKKNEILFYSYYFGMKTAMWKGFTPIVIQQSQIFIYIIIQLKQLLINTLFLLRKLQSILPEIFKEETIQKDYFNYIKYAKKTKGYANKRIKYPNLRIFFQEQEKMLQIINCYQILTKNHKFIENEIKFHLHNQRNQYYLSSCNVPINLMQPNIEKSFLSKQLISVKIQIFIIISMNKCDGYVCENMKSYMLLSEALMWSLVNPLSPLNSGFTIDPL